jgi:hypothetical protein
MCRCFDLRRIRPVSAQVKVVLQLTYLLERAQPFWRVLCHRGLPASVDFRRVCFEVSDRIAVGAKKERVVVPAAFPARPPRGPSGTGAGSMCQTEAGSKCADVRPPPPVKVCGSKGPTIFSEPAASASTVTPRARVREGAAVHDEYGTHNTTGKKTPGEPGHTGVNNDARDDVGGARAPRHDSPFRTHMPPVLAPLGPLHTDPGLVTTEARASAAPGDSPMLDAPPSTIKECYQASAAARPPCGLFQCAEPGKPLKPSSPPSKPSPHIARPAPSNPTLPCNSRVDCICACHSPLVGLP